VFPARSATIASMTSAGPGIKGNILLSRLKYIRDRGGEEAFEKVMARLSPEDQKVLRGWILQIGWYPFDLNQRLDGAIARVFSPDDRSRVFVEMGRASADANLEGLQKPYLKAGDPHFLLGNAERIYAAYYQVGHRAYERTGDRSGILRTYDAETFSATDCLTVVGWHERAIELCGGKNVKVVETQCRARGGAHCEYAVSWDL
jgi:uncharacterized protein (TIGR02265 family)